MKITVNGVVCLKKSDLKLCGLNSIDKNTWGEYKPASCEPVKFTDVEGIARDNNLDCRRDENGDYHLTSKPKFPPGEFITEKGGGR